MNVVIVFTDLFVKNHVFSFTLFDVNKKILAHSCYACGLHKLIFHKLQNRGHGGR